MGKNPEKKPEKQSLAGGQTYLEICAYVQLVQTFKGD